MIFDQFLGCLGQKLKKGQNVLDLNTFGPKSKKLKLFDFGPKVFKSSTFLALFRFLAKIGVYFDQNEPKFGLFWRGF